MHLKVLILQCRILVVFTIGQIIGVGKAVYVPNIRFNFGDYNHENKCQIANKYYMFHTVLTYPTNKYTTADCSKSSKLELFSLT